MTDVSIQIINYKTKKYLSGCLDSLLDDLNDSGLSFEILVLDNASGENLSDLEKKYENSPVKFFHSDRNVGFGAGHNFLARQSDGKYMFLLNPDTVVKKNCVKTLFDFMENHPEAGLCGPRIKENDCFLHS